MKRKTTLLKKLISTFILVNGFIGNAQISQTIQPPYLTAFPTTDGQVRAMVWDSVNNCVYIGGTFAHVGGLSRVRFAAIDASTGAVLSWNPSFNNDIQSLCLYKGMLYAGGSFTSAGGQSRKGIAKFKTSNQTISTWSSALGTSISGVNSIKAKGNFIYMGGQYTLPNTQTSLCRIDTGTAAIDSWNPGLGPYVSDMDVSGDDLYVAFGNANATIGGQSRSYLVAFNGLSTASPSVDPLWDPQADNNIYSVKAYGGSVYVGGGFAMVGGQTRGGVACLNPTGSIGDATSLDIQLNNICFSVQIKKNMLYLGGDYSVVSYGGNSYTRGGALTEFDLTNMQLTRWNPSALGSYVQSMTLGANKVYAGGLSYFEAYCTNFTNPIEGDISLVTSTSDVCVGQTTAVTFGVDNTSGATSYNWSNSLSGITVATPTNNTVNMSYSAAVAGTNTITVYGTNGCINTNTITTSVNVYQFATTVSPNSNNITCGDSVDINSADNYAGSGSITYSWAPATGLNATNVYKVTSGVHTTTTYTLTETTTDGCVAKDNTTITVNPFNLNTSSLSSTILCSTTDSLHVTNDYPGLGTVTYTWSPSASVSLPHGANISANPVVSTDYTVTASATGGCTASPQTIFVSVDPISLSAGNTSGNITCGDATQLSANNNYPGAGTLTYIWFPSAGLNNVNITNPTANPIATTTYTLTLNSPEGCVSTDQTTIIVNALQVNVTNTVSTGCHSPVTLSTSANTSNSNLVYSWTPSGGLNNANIASPTAVVGVNTTYNVTMSLPSSGCSNANNSVNISLANPNGLPICMVTVDSASTHNIVYWDKTGLANSSIDSFRIYREITTNVYGIVGTVYFSSLSEFHDYNANPNVTTYRYKIAALDSCGLESPLSFYHNTVYIISVGGGQYTWNPGYTIESSTNPVNNYLLMRDDNNNGTWYQVASTSGSQSTIADPTWASYPNANWQVVTAWSISCSPTAKQSNGTLSAIVKSKSNISNNRTVGVKNTESNFSVYPNPTNGNLTISFTNSTPGKINVKIMSAIGQEVFGETFTQTSENHNVDLSKYESGIYLVQITTNNTTVIKRIVKN